MKYLVLGCNGMAGHMISLYLKKRGYEVDGFAKSDCKLVRTIIGDARDTVTIRKLIEQGRYQAVINCVGLLNQFAENDHEAAVLLNSYLPHFLSKITEQMDTKIIHISTDCVFSGSRGKYTERDYPDGESFYDRTKAMGEINNNKDLTFRMSIIGPDIHKNGIGLLNWFMQQKHCVKGYKYAIWTGQTTLQLAKTIENATLQGAYGLYNMVPNTSISKYDLLNLFNKYLRKKPIQIDSEENFQINKSLERTNFESFNYKIPEYEQQILELGNWMRHHADLYPHYEL